MKHSIAVKFIAIFLCALSIVSTAACGFGILFLEAANLYNEPLEKQRQEKLETMAQGIAWSCAERQAAESLGNCPNEILDDILPGVPVYGEYAVLIRENGKTVLSLNDPGSIADAFVGEFTITPCYPVVTYQYMIDENGTEATQPESPAEEEPGYAAGERAEDTSLARVENQTPVYSTQHEEGYYQNGTYYRVVYTLNYYQGPEYTVSVYLAEKSVLGTEFALMSLLYPYREMLIPLVLLSLLTFAVTLVYLIAAAGRTKSGQIVPAGLNRLPLDLYLLLAGGGIIGLTALMILLIENYYYGYYSLWDNIPLCMLVLGLGGFLIALLAIGFLFAFAAQVKVRGGFWWRHTVCGWMLGKLGGFFGWVRRGLRYFYRGCRAVVRLMPVIWQWLLTAFLMVMMPVLFFFLTISCHGVIELFWGALCILSVIADVAMVCYGGWCFGTLLKGARAMSRGELNHQIPTRYLFGTFRDFAEQMNAVAGAARIAAEREMKSERMKTELITNVSHDIKTPLTSIINFVDLMKKPHSEAEGEQYLEVLDRQSQRLKKLIDDLMEMSKASSGNITVELSDVDAVEAVNQALGEFADKLDRAGLTPVFRHPDFPVTMRADGKLVWRVMSNILNNAVKYAMPETRLYIDLMVLQGNAVIAVKNISRDQLNVNADELMERFVRGDASRNTEGSGLGLNIAKSLVEIQSGQMHLMVDGDLFKVTLIFPCA